MTVAIPVLSVSSSTTTTKLLSFGKRPLSNRMCAQAPGLLWLPLTSSARDSFKSSTELLSFLISSLIFPLNVCISAITSKTSSCRFSRIPIRAAWLWIWLRRSSMRSSIGSRVSSMRQLLRTSLRMANIVDMLSTLRWLGSLR